MHFSHWYSSGLHQPGTWVGSVIWTSLIEKKTEIREAKWLAQLHIIRKWQSQVLNIRSLYAKSWAFSGVLYRVSSQTRSPLWPADSWEKLAWDLGQTWKQLSVFLDRPRNEAAERGCSGCSEPFLSKGLSDLILQKSEVHISIASYTFLLWMDIGLLL